MTDREIYDRICDISVFEPKARQFCANDRLEFKNHAEALEFLNLYLILLSDISDEMLLNEYNRIYSILNQKRWIHGKELHSNFILNQYFVVLDNVCFILK